MTLKSKKLKKNMLFVTLLLFSILLLSAYNSIYNNQSDSHHDAIYNNQNNGNKKNNSDTAFKVVIDPGHGGKDVGATGASGQNEENFTLSVSKKVKKLLEQEPHIQVYMTREDDRFISQESRYRPQYANNLNADLFISIHGNSFSDPNVSGTETFYYHKNSRLFAEILQKQLVEATGFRDRGVKKKELFVVKDTIMPAALLEVGYLTNPQDETKMWTDDFQNRVATAIVEGIKAYRGIIYQ